jgi:hypothetical protein
VTSTRWIALLLVLVPVACDADEDTLPVLRGGTELGRFLDAMQVEEHWIAGHHVNWRTGDPDGRPVPAEGAHSHCSAFVAAAATRLGIDILRPPDHSQILLANAQCRWLSAEGEERGWQPVATPLEAQQAANRGELVVACWIDPDPKLPGHIAIVRPDALSRRRIDTEGPQITQAGIENFRSASLARGFRHDPRAWADRAIRFFAHSLPRAAAAD